MAKKKSELDKLVDDLSWKPKDPKKIVKDVTWKPPSKKQMKEILG